MLKLSVPDMSCSHCAGTITRALKAVDADAAVTIDLPAQTVTVESRATLADITRALEAAGYPATTQ